MVRFRPLGSVSTFSSNNSTPLQRALQTLQNSLASGDLNGAQSAFQTLQKLYQNSATSSGSTLSSTSQLSTDLSALGSALNSGDLSTAQSALLLHSLNHSGAHLFSLNLRGVPPAPESFH